MIQTILIANRDGKSVRLIHDEKESLEANYSAKAKTSLGNNVVYIQKHIESPHHIEIQLLGDTHGNVIHLFNRECSVQHRHPKIVKGSPSPFIDKETQ
jgi:Acetyl/propionyl-CoA carboxylase, alpha subunit